VTDGSRPIGHGVGPALELIDVRAVLEGRPNAPESLADKAMDFAGAMIEWDPAVAKGTGRARARELVASGAALAAFERIVDAQGPRVPVRPGPFAWTVTADAPGVVAALDGFALAGLARAAGAPEDKGAGVEVLAPVGAVVSPGDPLLRIVSGTASGLERAGTPLPADIVTLR